MGTRHLICIVNNGEYKAAQYGQWDGYPSGQGIKVLNFLRNFDKNVFVQKLKNCCFISDEEYDRLKKDYGSIKIFLKKFPQFSRYTSSEILQIILQSDNTILLYNSIQFSSDSLFCEYAYVIDLDKNTFEIFQGFNKSPLGKNDRFYNEYIVDSEYYPVKLLKEYSIDNLPSDAIFLSDLEDQCEEN